MPVSDTKLLATTRGYSINPSRDRLIALAKLVQWYEQRTGRRLHRSVTYRWRQRGVAGIKLPTIRLGGTRYTSEEAIAWWTAAIDGQERAFGAHPSTGQGGGR